MKKRIILFFTFLSLIRVLCFAQDLTDYFCKTQSFKRAQIGICVVDLDTKEEIYSLNAEKFFIPASLQKIVISAAAIFFLKDDYRFFTDLEYEGTIDNGILYGNVWIKGGGDPMLSLDIIPKWEKALKKEGINRIEGKIIVDTSIFESRLASPYWCFEDLANYYGAGACGISINRNFYNLTFKVGKDENEPAKVLKIDPPIANLMFHNEVTTGPKFSGDGVYVFGSEYSNTQFYRGTVPLDHETFTVKAAIPDPAYFLGKAFLDRVNASKGIEVIRNKIDKKAFRKLLYRSESIPLKEIIKEMNPSSINLYAEHLLKAIGDGKSEEGTKKIKNFLNEKNIPSQIKDGAGIARKNLITPKGFVDLLILIKDDSKYQIVYDSLTEPGQKGTLYTFKQIDNARLKAKTGSMSNIWNLGGYLKDEKKEYAFCIFCNNYDGSIKEVKEEIYLFLNELAKEL